ncbi:hypothetical protein HDU79_010110 [Rhizoclosmatium sp. JEL0117]|nr:hypothetical protein HDU79_010110 [Rhizoclosmatium sp. JEL0117]
MAMVTSALDLSVIDRLDLVLEKQRVLFSRLQGSRLARSALFSTSQLRDKWVLEMSASNQDDINDLMKEDADFKRERADILKQHNLPQMIQVSQQISASIIQSAKADGFLPSGVDPLPPLTVDDL